MHRLVALIAMIFAFSSVAGMATAHAHRYVSTPLVVLNLVDEQNVSIPVMVSVQRGEIDLGSGIVMPCGPHQAIPLTEQPVPPAPECAAPVAGSETARPVWGHERPLRPPKTA